MMKNNKPLDQKVKAHVHRQFADVGESQELFDLKEELVTNMKEKIDDFRSKGMDEDQAFKEAIISMGDLQGLVDDMRKHGQDTAKHAVYSSMTTRISIAGIVAGSLLILFGLLTSAMLYTMGQNGASVSGSGIFVVAGGALLTYSILTRETNKRFGMNKIRASLYALAIGLILFGAFAGITSGLATKQTYIAIASLMIFCLAGIGLWMSLWLTGSDRRKGKV